MEESLPFRITIFFLSPGMKSPYKFESRGTVVLCCVPFFIFIFIFIFIFFIFILKKQNKNLILKKIFFKLKNKKKKNGGY